MGPNPEDGPRAIAERMEPWTPGPWEVARDTSTKDEWWGWWLYIGPAKRDRAVAMIWGEEGARPDWSEADARLIAAAPRMAEVLRHAADGVNVQKVAKALLAELRGGEA